MDSFESIVATVFEFNGYWVQKCYKINLTKEEKRKIGRPSSPRWELDLIAYKGRRNEVLVIECKSYLDSSGVKLRSFKGGRGEGRYKLFNDVNLKKTVFSRLEKQLVGSGFCRANPTIKLALATGKIATQEDREDLSVFFKKNGWLLFSDEWLKEQVIALSNSGYENEVAIVVTKLLMRNHG